MINHRFTFAYPSNGQVSVPFMESNINMVFHELTKPREACLMGSRTQVSSCHVPLNRNSICEFFLNKTTDDFLIMIDTDVEFKATILEEFNALINEYGPAAGTALYARDKYPHIISGRVDISNGMPVFYKKFNPGEYKQDPRPFKGLKTFDNVGTGIICISRYCLKALINEDPDTGYHFFGHREEGGKLASDDFSFMFHAKKYGFVPMGAWDIRGIHSKSAPIQPRYLETVEEFEAYRNNPDNKDSIPIWLQDETYK